MFEDDRREFQRLQLAKPILATVRGKSALVLDIGLAGALIEHHGRAEAGENFELRFLWHGEPVQLGCRVIRTSVVRALSDDLVHCVSHTGVQFENAESESLSSLQQLIASYVAHILAAQRANAAGESSPSAGKHILARIGEARRRRSSGFISWRLQEDGWIRSESNSSAQPPDGFTVAAWEDDEDVSSLCATYAAADEEGRRLIRLIAELSAAGAQL